MRNDEIVKLALSIKERFNTIDTFKICEYLDVNISYTTLKPNIYKAYTFKLGKRKAIVLNKHFTLTSQKVLCAHELGHFLMHNEKILNQFNDEYNGNEEFEANLFAVALLFEQKDLCINISSMDNYLLKGLLNFNIKVK